MNKKFLNMCLIGTLMVGFAGLAVSCKDYDDDIDALNEKISATDANVAKLQETVTALQAAINAGAVIKDVQKTADGIKVVLSNGNSYDVLNGAKGDKGDKGDKGETGAQGEKGDKGDNGQDGAQGEPAVITIDPETGMWVINGVITEFPSRGAVGPQGPQGETGAQGPQGETGAQGPQGETGAQGEQGIQGVPGANAPMVYYKPGADGKWIKVTEVLGEEPVEEATGESCFPEGTLTAVWDAETNSLSIFNAEGSEGPIYICTEAIRSISYRKQYTDDAKDIVTSYLIYRGAGDYFATAPGKATFKVFPASFDVTKAGFAFTDVYQTKADEVPAGFDIKKDMTKLENGILDVYFTPNAGIEADKPYATALEITLNKNTTASDYFKAMGKSINAKTIQNVYLDKTGKINAAPDMDPDREFIYLKDTLSVVYNESLDLKPILNAAIVLDEDKILLADANVEHEISFELIDEPEKIKWADKNLVNAGYFDADKAKEGVVEVVNHSVAALENYAVIKMTTTIKANLEEDAEDYEIVNYVAVKVCRPGETVKPADQPTVVKLNKTDISEVYSPDEPIVVELDVKSFEEAIGGRDYLPVAYPSAAGNYYDLTFPLYKKNIDGTFTRMSGKKLDNYSVEPFDPEKKNVYGTSGEAYVVFAWSRTNAIDHMYLCIAKGTKLDKDTYYVGQASTDKVIPDAPVETINNKLYNFVIENLEVKRDFQLDIFEEYADRMIVGNKLDMPFKFTSEKFEKMYKYDPKDANVVFDVKGATQSDAIKALIDKGQLTFVGNVITLTPPVDLKTLGKFNVDIYDAGYSDDPYRTETWGFKDPVLTLKGITNAPDYYNINLGADDDNRAIALKNWAGLAFKNAELKDRFGRALLKVTADTKTSSIALTNDASDYYAMTLKYELDPSARDWEIDETTGVLTFTGETPNTRYVKTLNVKVTFAYNWGTQSANVAVKVIRDVKED